MKNICKNFNFALLILLAGLMVGCNNIDGGENDKENIEIENEIEKDEILNASNYKFNDDNTITIEIEGNPTTGYEWTVRELDESIIKLIDDNYETDDEGALDGMTLIGMGGKYSFTFEMIAEGTTDVTFDYARSWEGEPIETKTYTITKDSEGKISAIEKE